MAKERNNLKAGIFILVSIALIVTVILSITGIERIFSPEQNRRVSFRLSDDLGGLQVGDEVRLGGFKVGVVKAIQVRDDVKEVASKSAPTTAPAKTDKTRLLVTFTVPTRYELHEDAVVGVQSTITGTACLNISDIGTGKVAGDEVALVGQPSALNSLLASLGGVGPELKPMIADARLAVADVRAKTVPELNQALSKYKGAGAHLEDMLGQSKGDFRGTVANLKSATGTINEKLPGTMDAAHQFIARLDETVKNTSGTLDDVKASMANFRSVSEKAREVIGGNKGKLDSMIASLKVTGDNLKAASAEIRHSPWRLLYKPGKGEVANLNLYDTARQFADGAGSLNDAALALRDALANKNANPEEVKELLKKLDESFANFRQVEDKLWTTVQQ
jgi:ABC-type transporter Mla subunit MlaD